MGSSVSSAPAARTAATEMPLIRTGIGGSSPSPTGEDSEIVCRCGARGCLEALASGLPIASNRSPVLEWIVGEAGFLMDISQPGAMALQLRKLSCLERDLSRKARSQAVETFSEDVVIPKILAMYQQVARWSA